MVWPTLGLKAAKEQNITKILVGIFLRHSSPSLPLLVRRKIESVKATLEK